MKTFKKWGLLGLFLILSACMTQGDGSVDPNATKPTAAKLVQFATALGDAAIQLEGTQALRERAPHVLAMLDANHNGVLELAELTAFKWDKPEDLVAVYIVVEQLLKARR